MPPGRADSLQDTATTPATGPPLRPQYQPESPRRAGQDAGQDRPRHRATPPGLSVSPGHPQHHRRHRGHRRRKPSAARRGLSVRDSNGHRFRADSLSNGHPGHRATPPGLSVSPGHPQHHRRHRGHRRRKPSAARRGLSVRDSNGHRFRADSLSNGHPGHRATPPGLSVSPGHPQHHRRHRGHRRRKPSAARRGLSVRDSNGHRFPPGCQYQHHRRRDMPAADSGHRFRAGTPCGNMPPGHPQPGNPPRFRADSFSNGHPGRRGKRPPQPGQPAGQDAAGPGRFPARHRHNPGHRATLAASVSAGKPPPGGARCRARPPPPPGHPAGAVSQSGPPSAPPPPPGTPPPETLSRPPGAVSPG